MASHAARMACRQWITNLENHDLLIQNTSLWSLSSLMAGDRVVEEIKQRLDLVEYIGRTVDLKRAGRTYKACCPFHAEKTPSFIVFPHTGTWRCFGACGEGGDIFSYVQKREGLTFSEALRQLAQEAGVALEEESEAQREARAERERLLAVCQAAMEQFQSWLRELPDGQHCREYVASRGITKEMIQRFNLGYAPESWDALVTTLTGRGYNIADLLLLGLARERDNGGFYDVLRDRLVFPIRDVRGQVVGFGGRALHADQVPKYINSPQSPLFDKSRTLYGLDLAKDAIRAQERAVIAEGYMDVIAAHQMGFTNVVASLGTALTAEQVRLLRRYSPHVTLALDADAAGQKAAERGLETALNFQKQVRNARWERARHGRGTASDVEGDVRILRLPEGLDPDDLLRNSPERWEALVDGALPVMDFLIQQRLKGLSLDDAVQKAQVASELLPLIAESDSSVVRDHYLQRVARLLHVDERILAQELAKHLGQRKRAPQSLPPQPHAFDEPPPPDYDGWESYERPEQPLEILESEQSGGLQPASLEGYLLYLFMEHPRLLELATAYEVRPDMWDRTEQRQLYDALLRIRPAGAAQLEEFLEELDAPVAGEAKRILGYFSAQPAVPHEETENEAQVKVIQFLIRHHERQARHLHFMLDDMQRTLESDPQAMIQLLQQKTVLEQGILRHQKALAEQAKARKIAEPNR
jgi:DNA primase